MKWTLRIGSVVLATVALLDAYGKVQGGEADRWLRDLDAARTAAKLSGKPLFVVFR
jgi:hypothetical protein